MNSISIRYFLMLFLVLLMRTGLSSENIQGNKKLPADVKGSPTRTYLNINTISTQFSNDGTADIDISGNSGFVFPKGSGKTCVFQSGLIWGAKVEGDNQVQVGGSAYGTGLQAGKIVSAGFAEDPALTKNRIYRVRADVFPGASVDLSSEAALEGKSASALYDQYILDWNEWPIADGAPYWIDVDGIITGVKMAVIPGVKGANQTIWFVANDLNANLTKGLYGTQPLGIEYQATYWAYNKSGALGDVIFRKYKLINKSNTPFTNMYISMWADPDVGTATDDFVGCDTSLSLGYAYNASSVDLVYDPLPPPAVGFQLLEGPIVNGSSLDTAYFGDRLIIGKKNIPMTAFYYFTNGDASVTDPPTGSASGATQFYNFFQGRVGLTGELFQNPQNQSTTFALSGDPVTKTGWIDGQLRPEGDRRLGLSCGPIYMAIGDTQEVIYAESAFLNRVVTPNANLSNVNSLKDLAGNLMHVYKNRMAVSVQADQLVKTNSPMTLKAETLFFDLGEVVSNISWHIISSPTGSNALINSASLDADFTPDIAGEYKIVVTLKTVSGKVANGIVTVEAIDLKPPKAEFRFASSEITYGDSVLIDASSSSDPQNLSLNYSWSTSIYGVFNKPTGKTTYYTPYNAGLQNCILHLNNGTFSVDTSRPLMVHPKLWNINAQSSLAVDDLADSSNYQFIKFQGDTLYCTIRNPTVNQIRVYSVKNNSFELLHTLDIPGIQQVVKMENKLLYGLTDATTSYTLGNGPLSIFSIGEDWSITPLLQNFTPTGKDIVGIKFIDSLAYIYDYSSISCVNFNNPAAPVIKYSIPLSYYNARYYWKNYLTCLTKDNVTGTCSIVLRNLTTLDSVTTWHIPKLIYSFSFAGNYLLTTYYDTLDVYDVSNIASPVKISSAYTQSPVPWIKYDNYYGSVSDMGANLIDLSGEAGDEIYNISNPLTPQLVASYYGGGRKQIISSTGGFLAVPKDMRITITPGSSIDIIQLTNPNDVSEAVKINANFSLGQNYPNPFNPSTKITFTVPVSDVASLRVFDVLGNEVAVLFNQNVSAGKYEVEFNGKYLASGIYFYRLQAGNFSQTKKFVLLK